MGEQHSALDEFGLLKDTDQPWGKRDNWRIAREMNAIDLDGTDLGNFLSSL